MKDDKNGGIYLTRV